MSPAAAAEARTATLMTALAGATIAAGAYTLTEVIWSGGWIGLVIGVLAAVVAVVATTRWLVLARSRRTSGVASRMLPTGVGAVVAAVLWVALGTSTDPDAVDVGAGPLSRAITELGQLHHLAAVSVAPLDPVAPAVVGALGATLLLYLLSDLLVVVLRAPVAATAPALVLWLPAIVIEAHVPPASIAITLVALLCLLAADRASLGAAGGREFRISRAFGGARVVAGAVTITVVSLVIGTAANAFTGSDDKPLARVFGTDAGAGRLGNDLNVLNDLGARPTSVVMTLSSVSGNRAIGPLQVYTLTRFDGSKWQPDGAVPATTKVTPSDLLWPATDERSGDLTTTAAPRRKPTATVSVRPVLLPRARLAVPTEPRTVASSTSIEYAPADDEVYRGAGSSDSSYTINVYRRDLEPRSLAQQPARFAADAPVTPRAEAESLQVPHSSHIADITALTKKITASGKNDYERALLVQAYFRDAGVFSYTTKAPRAVTGDPVWDFLQARSGYCVQYATAMAIMLRTLGIPTRVGVGYLTHSMPARGTRNVTERDAHAWPEIYFAGSGWVRFEPTPAVQSGAEPAWAAEPIPGGSSEDGYEHDALDPRNLASSEPQAGASKVHKDGNQVAHGAAAAKSAHRPAPETGGIVAGIAVVVMLLLGTGLWWRRRRLRERQIHDAEDAWRQLRRRLEALDVTWPDSVTPRRVPGLVAEAVRERTDLALTKSATRALDELADALEGTRYARADRVASRAGAELADRVEDVVVGVRESLRSTARR